MNTKHRLLVLADAFGAAVELSRATVSTRVLGRGGALDAIEDGRDIGCDRFDRAVAWFAANWPAGTPWPEGIARPPDVTAGSPAPSRCGASQSAPEVV